MSGRRWMSGCVVVLAVLTACGTDGTDRPAGSAGGNAGVGADTGAAGPDTLQDAGGWQECRHAAGYVARYPADWVTNDGSVMPPCALFDPEPFTVPPASEVPEDIAVTIHVDEVSYDDVAGSDFAIDILESDDVTVAGMPGVRRLVEHTGAALYEAGMQSYEYIVDWGDGRTLIAVSHDVGQPDFSEKRRVLDAMMERLRRP